MITGRYDERDAALQDQLMFMAPRMAAESRRLEREYRNRYAGSINSDSTYYDRFLLSPAGMAGAAALKRELNARGQHNETLNTRGTTESPESYAVLQDQLAPLVPRMAAESAGQYYDNDILSPRRMAAAATVQRARALRLQQLDEEAEIKALASDFRREANMRAASILGSSATRNSVRIGGKRRTFKHHKKTRNKKRRKRKTKAKY